MWYSISARRTDLLEYLRIITAKRLLNILKLITGYGLSMLMRRPLLWGSPLALSTEPSGYCQLKCPECPTGAGTLTRRKGLMTPELFQKTLDQAGPELMYLNLFFQGEPLLNTQLPKMIDQARQHRLYTTVSTNGLRLDQRMCELLISAGLSRILISLDGMTQKVYEKYRRGGNVEEVKEGIERLLAARKRRQATRPLIVVQFIAFGHNIHELEELKRWCRLRRVDKLEIKTAQISGLTDHQTTPPPDQKLSRYRRASDGTLLLKNRLYNHCWRQWSSAVVAWDGQLAPCCYDKDLDHSMGNLQNHSLKTMWNGAQMKDFKAQILKDKSKINICINCPEGRHFI